MLPGRLPVSDNRKLPKMPDDDLRVPFLVTAGSVSYEGIRPLPVCVLLENVRSAYNVGAFFRTADGAAIEKLYLTGITGFPPSNMIAKTALGAEETVNWEHTWTQLPNRNASGGQL